MIKGIIFEDQCIRFSDFVKNVGVWIEKNLDMKKHVSDIVSHCSKILKDIGSIKRNLERCQVENLVHAVITSRLDYCNSLLLNIDKEHLFKLQKMQNSAARLVLGRQRRESARSALRELHWLNVEARIIFKVLLLVFKVIKGQCSNNLSFEFKSFNGRPDDFLLLKTPNYKTKYGRRIFGHSGSRLWNALPVDIRVLEDIEIFKKKIKTLLFNGCEDLKNKAFKYTR